jgi:hypothetical protein
MEQLESDLVGGTQILGENSLQYHIVHHKSHMT